MIREAIKLVEEVRPNMEILRNDIHTVFLKTDGKLKKEFNFLLGELDKIIKLDLGESLDEGWLSKIKKLFKTYKITKLSDIKDDFNYISNLIDMITKGFEYDENTYLEEEMENFRIRFVQLQRTIEKEN